MRIGIVGAGITGLTAAYELGKAGHSVTVFEKDTFAGGLASGFKDETLGVAARALLPPHLPVGQRHSQPGQGGRRRGHLPPPDHGHVVARAPPIPSTAPSPCSSSPT